MDNNKQENNPDIDKTLRQAKTIFYVGIVLVVLSPIVFTGTSCWSRFDFRNTGQIGDTIGGLTAPIVNLIGAILVYYALRAQIEANRIIQNQINDQKKDEVDRKKLTYIGEKVNMVRNDINEFTFTYTEETSSGGQKQKQKFNFEGSDAINEFIDTLRYIGEKHEEDEFASNPKLTELYNLLQVIDASFDSLEKENITADDKQFFKSLLIYQFNSKVRPAFTANEKFRAKNYEPCKKCGKRHQGIPDKIFDLVDKIDGKAK